MFKLKPLPYALEDLEPHISSNTMKFHYEKHHGGYVNKLNELLKGVDKSFDSLEEAIEFAKKEQRSVIFNNAAQVWNHDFFWASMKKDGGGEPSNLMKEAINKNFGSYKDFYEKFTSCGVSQFGSGWVWLLMNKETGALEIASSSNAEQYADGFKPILVCDVWEHAYYLDYQNRRPDFLKAFLDNLVNWDFAEENMSN